MPSTSLGNTFSVDPVMSPIIVTSSVIAQIVYTLLYVFDEPGLYI